MARIITAIVGWIAAVAPFLSLAPTAWLVGVRTYEHLHWPWPVALVAALAVELLGLAVSVTALDNGPGTGISEVGTMLRDSAAGGAACRLFRRR